MPLSKEDRAYMDGKMWLSSYYLYLQEQHVLSLLQGVVQNPKDFYETATHPQMKMTPKDLVKRGKIEQVLAWIDALGDGVFQ